MNQKEVLLSARDLQVHFPVSRHLIPSRRKIVQAVNGIDLMFIEAKRSALLANQAAENPP